MIDIREMPHIYDINVTGHKIPVNNTYDRACIVLSYCELKDLMKTDFVSKAATRIVFRITDSETYPCKSSSVSRNDNSSYMKNEPIHHVFNVKCIENKSKAQFNYIATNNHCKKLSIFMKKRVCDVESVKLVFQLTNEDLIVNLTWYGRYYTPNEITRTLTVVRNYFTDSNEMFESISMESSSNPFEMFEHISIESPSNPFEMFKDISKECLSDPILKRKIEESSDSLDQSDDRSHKSPRFDDEQTEIKKDEVYQLLFEGAEYVPNEISHISNSSDLFDYTEALISTMIIGSFALAHSI